jgi:hypothetical protein
MHGAVGLPLNPTALLPEPGKFRLQADYFDLGESFDEDAGEDEAEFRFYGLHAAARVGNRWEINGGIESVDLSDITDDDFEPLDRAGFAIGVKYLITRELARNVALAVGGGYSSAYARNLYAYIVASKAFNNGISRSGGPILGHLGLRYDRSRAGFEDDEARSRKASVYGGIEVPFARSLTFVGELQSKSTQQNYDPGHDEPRASYSASVRWHRPGSGFSVGAGWQRRGYPQAGQEDGPFLQVGYTFD